MSDLFRERLLDSAASALEHAAVEVTPGSALAALVCHRCYVIVAVPGRDSVIEATERLARVAVGWQFGGVDTLCPACQEEMT